MHELVASADAPLPQLSELVLRVLAADEMIARAIEANEDFIIRLKQIAEGH
jgi:hypothetical protein